MSAPLDVSAVELDVASIFQLYCVFCGDVVRVAHVAGIKPVDVLKVASAEGWDEKLGPILELSRSQKPGDWERACSRALNYVQAHKLRTFLERVIHRITGMNSAELDEYIFQSKLDKEGKEVAKVLSTRALADLASAVEKTHAMTYLSLSDTAQDRGKRKEQTADVDGDCGSLHLRIAQAMSQVRDAAKVSPRLALLDAQVTLAASIVQEVAKTAKDDVKAASPYNNEDH